MIQLAFCSSAHWEPGGFGPSQAGYPGSLTDPTADKGGDLRLAFGVHGAGGDALAEKDTELAMAAGDDRLGAAVR